MTVETEPETRKGYLPSTLEELELFVRRAVGNASISADYEKAAVYSRVSNLDPRSRSYSMEFQPDRAEEYVRSKNWEIAGLYADPDRTGRNSKRPDLQRMIRDIESGRITVVVVHRLDRLYRNLESLLRFLRFLKKHRVRLVSVTEQIDTDSWWGRLVLYVLGALAEMYVWQTSVRVREIKAELSRKGHHNGTVPIGYCKGLCSTCEDLNGPEYCPLVGQQDRAESQRGRIPVPHPVDMHVVMLVHTLYSQGMSYQDIASHLNTYRFRLPGPDGQSLGPVQFRTKCSRNKRPGRPFHRDSIREIICNPFYVGMVVRRPYPALDMDDDQAPGAPGKATANRPRKLPEGMSRRSILEMHQGRHEGIIPLGLWQANQQERQGRGNTPNGGSRAVREYLLTGVGYCWECHQWDGRQASLHGVTGNHYAYYRCSTVQREYKTRRQPAPGVFAGALDLLGLGAEEQKQKQELLNRHRSTIQQQQLEHQISQLVEQLVIPEAWYERILAYYLSDKGLSDFELNSYNLRQELSRQRELFKRGHISQAEYEQAFLYIDRQLQKLQPSAQPTTQEIIPLLQNFSSLWQQMTLNERRTILQTMFVGLYFDAQCQLRKASASSPFDQLLGLVTSETGVADG